jgi:hypothetical protein
MSIVKKKQDFLCEWNRTDRDIEIKNISRRVPLNRRSLHCAPPDFLWDLLALIHFVHPSLRKGAHAALSNAAWQEIRVRSGRDDKFVAEVADSTTTELSSRPERSWAAAHPRG